MRFAVAHKTATYLMVGFAYVAMIAGGGVSPMIALAGLVGLLGSWWWEPPNIRYERWSWIWTIASVFALVYSILTAIVTGDFLGVGSMFLIWLVVAKAYNRRAARDWQQMYLLAFLMLVAGSVLNADLTYGACFLGFVISATWALTLFHLRREMEDNLLVKHAADRASERVEVRRILDSKRIVGGRFFFGTGALSFGVFIVSAVIFLALPRVGFGFFLKNRGGLTLSGFSDGVHLGGHGVIKNDDTVVMRVEVDPAVGGRQAPEIHWRGIAFDHYEHGSWSRSKQAVPSHVLREIPASGTERLLMQWRDSPQPSTMVDNGTKQSIWLEPLDSDVLFGGGKPYVYEYAQIARSRTPKRLVNNEMRVDHGSTLHYTVWSDLGGPSPDELRAATGEIKPDYLVYLQLPDAITPRTRQLADKITKPYTNNYDKAVAIEKWLDANATYTLQLADPGAQEPIDFFLFDRKKGHCEYFASAFAVLARAAGIPTRQVNGFLGGEWNEYQGYVAVRAGDAHSWDEVFFPGKGWVTFDPTPPDRHDPLGRGGTGWRAKMSRFLDTLRFQWTKWVIEYDLVAQLALFKDIGHALQHTAASVRDAAIAILRFWPFAAIGALAILALVYWRRHRAVEALTGGSAARPRTRSSVAQSYEAALRQLAKVGHGREPAVTPREHAARLQLPIGDRFRELTELYYAAEWGGRRDPVAEQRASELATAIKAELRAMPR